MFEKTLQIIGLSPNEAKLYEALLFVESANISTLAIKAKVHRRNVYDCINKLIEKGLVSELILEHEKQYTAVNPQRLLGVLKEKEAHLIEQLPEMKKCFRTIELKEHVYIYKGMQGFKNYLQDILDVGKDVYCIGSKNGWGDPRLEPSTTRFYNVFQKKRLQVYNLFDRSMKKEIPEFLEAHNIPYKFLPAAYGTNSAIDIFGDHVVTFTGLGIKKLEEDITLFVMISKKLADSYRTWFKMIWNLLPGLRLKENEKG